MSFASPPVDSTISYPSSPESARSPPTYFTRTGALATPDYRTAIRSDPFEDLRKDRQEDGTLQQAVFNAQSNIAVSQPPGHHEQLEESAVWDTLSRFATAPSRPLTADDPPHGPTLQDNRKSLDVDAFKRLLLTGNTDAASSQGQQNRRPAPPPPRNNPESNSVSLAVPETSFNLPSPDAASSREIDTKRASFIDSLVQSGQETYLSDSAGKLPPPAPAPRRAKSVKSRGLSPVPAPAPAPAATEPVSSNEETIVNQERTPKKAPAPPLARRQSQRIPSNRSDDSINTPSPAASPAEPARPTIKAPLPPPPPPVRKQPSVTPRRPSQELAPTIEEPEAEAVPVQGSRKSSMDRPTPTGSRNSSISIKRPMPGLMSPPPLPPPRKGRGSSRSSMDGFRPSLATLMGNGDEQENTSNSEQPKQAALKDRSSLTASNADSILAELANLQKEVDAARRS